MAVIDGFVVVEVAEGEALVLEPQGDPAELAAWVRERAPSRRRLASWHRLAILAAICGVCCAVFIDALFVG